MRPKLGLGSYKLRASFHALREGRGPSRQAHRGDGGEGKIVEADTTCVGGKEENKHKSKQSAKPAIGGMGQVIVHTLVERDGGARSHDVRTSPATRCALSSSLSDRKSTLMTDTAAATITSACSPLFAKWLTTARTNTFARCLRNTVHGYFAILKRGIVGVFHSGRDTHLHRYLSEFDFRYSNRSTLGVEDPARDAMGLKGFVGNRLTFRQPRSAPHA